MIIDIVNTLPRHPEKDYIIRRLSSIDQIAIHHAEADHNPWQIARWHVGGKDWPGISYDAVITQDGQKWKTSLDREIGYHVRGNNTRSLGICVGMDLTHKEPPSNIYLALIEVTILYANAYGVSTDNIYGHRELVSSDCPGELDMEKVREVVRIFRR